MAFEYCGCRCEVEGEEGEEEGWDAVSHGCVVFVGDVPEPENAALIYL